MAPPLYLHWYWSDHLAPVLRSNFNIKFDIILFVKSTITSVFLILLTVQPGHLDNDHSCRFFAHRPKKQIGVCKRACHNSRDGQTDIFFGQLQFYRVSSVFANWSQLQWKGKHLEIVIPSFYSHKNLTPEQCWLRCSSLAGLHPTNTCRQGCQLLPLPAAPTIVIAIPSRTAPMLIILSVTITSDIRVIPQQWQIPKYLNWSSRIPLHQSGLVYIQGVPYGKQAPIFRHFIRSLYVLNTCHNHDQFPSMLKSALDRITIWLHPSPPSPIIGGIAFQNQPKVCTV